MLFEPSKAVNPADRITEYLALPHSDPEKVVQV